MTRQTRQLSIPPTHPTAALHFPGLPVVPGALLLDAAVELIAGAVPVRFRAVKFIAPVRHGEVLTLSWQQDGGLTSFTLHRPGEDAPLLTGTLETET